MDLQSIQLIIEDVSVRSELRFLYVTFKIMMILAIFAANRLSLKRNELRKVVERVTIRYQIVLN